METLFLGNLADRRTNRQTCVKTQPSSANAGNNNTHQFFRHKVLHEASCLHYLLPKKRSCRLTAAFKNFQTLSRANKKIHLI